MTFRIPLLLLATLLFLVALATLSRSADAHGGDPAAMPAGVDGAQVMSTGPLNIVTFRVTGR